MYDEFENQFVQGKGDDDTLEEETVDEVEEDVEDEAEDEDFGLEPPDR